MMSSSSSSKWTLCVSLLSCLLICSVSEDPEVKTVQPGGDVLLPCQDPRRDDIVRLQWIRPDLESEGDVFFFRDDLILEIHQHPSFRGRVNLTDPQMKDGDASVILKNVTINDTGTYECHVLYGGGSELISRINVTVSPPGGGDGPTEDGGDKDGRVSLVVVLSVVVLLLVVVVGVLIYRKRFRKLNLDQRPADEDVEEPLSM